jgi:beta-phosphoglucomutase-like phosphatase (HAD superfamily)
MFLEAAGRLGVPPARAAVFGDAISGIAAARAGGFELVVGVGRCGQAVALLESGANGVVADLGAARLVGPLQRVSTSSARQPPS